MKEESEREQLQVSQENQHRIEIELLYSPEHSKEPRCKVAQWKKKKKEEKEKKKQKK